MSFDGVLRGRIAVGPEAVEVEAGEEPATAFVVSDAQTGIYAGEEVPIAGLRCCEVVCRGETAVQVLDQLSLGDPVVVSGEVRISVPLDSYDDRGLVLVHISARAVGRDLAAAS